MTSKLKVLFVTGGSGTIGSEIVRIMNCSNTITAIGYNNSLEETDKLMKSLDYPENAIAVKCDLENEQSIKDAFRFIFKRFGRIDFLVNNAAYTENIPGNQSLDIEKKTIDKIFEVNFRGAVLCSFEAVKYILKNDSNNGNVVNIVSNSLKTHNASNIIYIASKAALQSFTESMAVHYGEFVKFNAVAPGLINSNITNSRYKRIEQSVLDKTPVGRLASSKDIANTVKFLLLDNVAINGQTLYVDGGRTIGS